MISLILYGRNDSYGYNLHKRAALSLNCMAEVLTDDDDEILFVDYNTPDDFPTFPEAIADTLTPNARQRLRVLRVRPQLHSRFAHRTHLKALEPVSRNVAVRRSNPANRWILSTNTDMIFVPRNGRTLTDIVRDLPRGHYGIPRFEVPETLWEGLDRSDPKGVIDHVGRWGWDLHLNEIVTGMKPFLFDGPGDFQLMERNDLFAIDGFDEDMLLGWHVDANIAKRLSFIHGDVGDLSDEIFGYHCDHTRQVTPAHKGDAVQNDMRLYFYDVVEAGLPKQKENWGCASDEIEEVKLLGLTDSRYLKAIDRLRERPLREPRKTAFVPETYNQCSYSPEHVLPFLLDIFASAPRHWHVAWIGSPGPMLDHFVEGWRRLGFTTPVLLHPVMQRPDLETPAVDFCSYGEIDARANAFVFDFSLGDGQNIRSNVPSNLPLIKYLTEAFGVIIALESQRLENGGAPRRFLGVNGIHNPFERMFDTRISCARTPFSVRIRHGFLNETKLPKAEPEIISHRSFDDSRAIQLPPPDVSQEGAKRWPILQMLEPGPAARKHNKRLHAVFGRTGLVARTKPIIVPPGSYRISLQCKAATRASAFSRFELWIVDAASATRATLGYKTERRIRRAAVFVLRPPLAERIKNVLRKRLSHQLHVDRLADLPLLQFDVFQGPRNVARSRIIGSDITTLKHSLVCQIGAGSQHAFVVSLTTNGKIGFELASLSLDAIEQGSAGLLAASVAEVQ